MLESSTCAGVKRGATTTGGALLARSIDDPPAAATPTSTIASQRFLFDIVILHAPRVTATSAAGHDGGIMPVAGDTGTRPRDVQDRRRCRCTAAARSCRTPCAP